MILVKPLRSHALIQFQEKTLNVLKCLPSKFLEESRKINSQTGQHDMNATMASDAVRLELRDNGKGFISDNANGDGIGLIGMRERAERIGATLAITSEPGGGNDNHSCFTFEQPVVT